MMDEKLMENFFRSEKGASLVEFALVLPLLLIILFGIIEFGLLLFNKQVITNASREGARAGIVTRSPRLPCNDIPGNKSISEIAKKYCELNVITLGAPNTPIVTCVIPEDPLSGTDLTVRVQYHFDFLVLPSFAISLIGGKDLVALTVMKYE